MNEGLNLGRVTILDGSVQGVMHMCFGGEECGGGGAESHHCRSKSHHDYS